MGKTVGAFNGGAALRRAGLAVLLAFTGWVAHELYDHACRLAEIEGNRFTSKNGLVMLKELSGKGWLTDRFDAVDARLGRLEDMLREHVNWHAHARTE